MLSGFYLVRREICTVSTKHQSFNKYRLRVFFVIFCIAIRILEVLIHNIKITILSYSRHVTFCSRTGLLVLSFIAVAVHLIVIDWNNIFNTHFSLVST